ncbi:MAG: hypothetical protein GF317_11760 [Candidatus Lokiarchaeota archaeon]|nr:hypothetical protein [Candidatus Lokiarchaeota archaeon]MBD3200321.1 hypothetical protein [Candidatus Lokiarchaeota archaeon]
MWDKIQQLRELIKPLNTFKRRKCWRCGKDLNIYDFLSDNVEYSAKRILGLWQSSMLEFHCCECFKFLKGGELQLIERILNTRKCTYCNEDIDLYSYSKLNNYLKIYELKDIWLNRKSEVFCNSICRKKYYRDLGQSSIRLK